MRIRLFASAIAVRDYFPLLRWTMFTGVTLFGFALAWQSHRPLTLTKVVPLGGRHIA